jgi:hypothetical protein
VLGPLEVWDDRARRELGRGRQRTPLALPILYRNEVISAAILRIDPKRNEVVKRIPITGLPHCLAFGLGRLWIALD